MTAATTSTTTRVAINGLGRIGRAILKLVMEQPSLVFECTGSFTRRKDLEKHLHAGARIALLSAPSKSADVVTVVHGANSPDASARITAAVATTRALPQYAGRCDGVAIRARGYASQMVREALSLTAGVARS